MFGQFSALCTKRLNVKSQVLSSIRGEIKVSKVTKGKIALDLIDNACGILSEMVFTDCQGLGCSEQHIES